MSTSRSAVRSLATAVLLGIGASAHAAGCQISIEANDMMQFSTRTLQIDSNCKEIQLTLKHVGMQPANVLGHDWVLARSSDVTALVNASMTAGLNHGYLPQDDHRVVAATKIIGGGEETTVTFSTASLAPGVEYSYFCSYPGHATLMRGRLVIAEKAKLADRR